MESSWWDGLISKTLNNHPEGDDLRSIEPMSARQWESLSLAEQERIMREKVFVVVGSGDYRGLDGFRLPDLPAPERIEDIEGEITPEKLADIQKQQDVYYAEVRKRLQNPDENTVKQMLELLHLDPDTPREVHGMSHSACQQII